MAIRHKRKTTGSYTWLTGDLVEGQIGINLVDGTLHVRNSIGGIETIQNKVDTDAAYATAAQGTTADSALQDLTGSPASELSDVTITANSSGEILKWNGSAWINNTLAEAGIEATGHTHTLADTTDVTATAAEVNLLDLAGLTAGHVLSADTATTASWKAPTGGLAALVDDTTPQLGGFLDTNGNYIHDATGPLLLGDGTASSNVKELSINTGITVAPINARTYVTNFTSDTQLSDDLDGTTRWRGIDTWQELDLNGFNTTGSSSYHYPTGMLYTTSVKNTGTAGKTVGTITGILSDMEVYNDVAVTNLIAFDTNAWDGTTGAITNFTAYNADFGNVTATNNYVLRCTDSTGKIDVAGTITTGAITLPNTDGTANQILETDGAGTVSWVTNTGGSGLANIVEDLTPELGGNLDLKGFKINDSTSPLLLGSAGLSTAKVIGMDYNETPTLNTLDRNYIIGSKSNTTATQNITGTDRWRSHHIMHDLDLNGFNYTGAGIYSGAAGIHNYPSISNTGTAGSTVTQFNGMVTEIDLYNDVALTDGVGYHATAWTSGTSSITNFTAFNADLSDTGITGNKYVLRCTNADATIDIAGGIVFGGMTFPTADGTTGQYLKTDGVGNVTWATPPGGMANIVEDSTPQLGGNLDLNGNDITGTGKAIINQAHSSFGTPITSEITGETSHTANGTFFEISRNDAIDFDNIRPTWKLQYKGAKAVDNWNQSYAWWIEQGMRGWNGATFYTDTKKTFLIDPGSFDAGAQEFNNGSAQFGVPLNAQKSMSSSSFGGNGTIVWNTFINDTGVPHRQHYAVYTGTGVQDVASTVDWDALYDPNASYNSSKGFWEVDIILRAEVASVNIIRALSPNDTLAVIGTEPAWVDSVNHEFNLVNGDTHQATYRGIAGNFSVEYKDWTH